MFDVCVRGSGAVALTAALALARQGLAVALQSQDPPAAARADVRTYALNAGAVKLLASLKVWEALPEDARTPVFDMEVAGDAGASLHFSSWAQGASQLAFIVDAAELEAVLRAAVRFAPHVRRVESDVAAQLLVLAEGKASDSRERLGVRMDLHRYGQQAVAARLVADRAHAGLARQWFRSPDILALLPFDRPQPGCSYGLVWSVPGCEAGSLTLDGPRAAWPLRLARAKAVSGPGWVLVGDAAHVVHPLAGQGLNLGLADVQALADVIAQREPWRGLGDEKLLRRYARRRHLPTLAMAGVTDALWHLFAQESPLWREARYRGLQWVDRLGPLKKALTARALNS